MLPGLCSLATFFFSQVFVPEFGFNYLNNKVIKFLRPDNKFTENVEVSDSTTLSDEFQQSWIDRWFVFLL